MAPKLPTDMLLATGLPAIPGSLWSMLSRLSWADPQLVRPEVITLVANLDGAVNGVANTPIDAAAVPAEETVVSRMFFLVEQLTGYVVSDPLNPQEDTLAEYVYVQIEDIERKIRYARNSFNLGDIAPTKHRRGTPMRFVERPLTWLPGANVRATFVAKAGFPVSVMHSMTTLSTREVGVILSGMLVDERIVAALMDANHKLLDDFGLLNRVR